MIFIFSIMPSALLLIYHGLHMENITQTIVWGVILICGFIGHWGSKIIQAIKENNK